MKAFWVQMIDLKFCFNVSRDVAMQRILWQNCGKIIYPLALIRNGMRYCLDNMRIYRSTNCCTSCEKMVKNRLSSF